MQVTVYIFLSRAERAFTFNSLEVEPQPAFNDNPYFTKFLDNRAFYLFLDEFYNKNYNPSSRIKKAQTRDNMSSLLLDLRIAYGFNQNSFRYPMVLIIGLSMFLFLHAYLFIDP